MNATIGAMINIFSPGGNAIDTGAIGAIAVGCATVWLHNRYHNIQLPQVLGFFGGSRFVPIITAVVSIFIGMIFFIIWPPFQNLLIASRHS